MRVLSRRAHSWVALAVVSAVVTAATVYAAMRNAVRRTVSGVAIDEKKAGLRAISHTRVSIAVLGGLVAVLLLGSAPSSASNGSSQVVVPRGQAVQIAFTAVTEPGVADISASIEKAIRLAVELRPKVSGFPIAINVVDTSCGGDNSAAAAAIVANTQNTAVLGHLCSNGEASALPLYEETGIVALTGSASADSLPALGPTVFDRTVVSDGDGGTAWYEAVKTLPADKVWRLLYQLRYGSAPTDLADLYFDATNLLITRLQQVSETVNGSLVINRAELAHAVRTTTRFPGVTCFITLDPVTGSRLNVPAELRLCGARAATA